MPNAFISRVRPGCAEVQHIFWPMMAFINDDFPTFDRPRNATSGSVDDKGMVRNWAAEKSLTGE
jgi:hypothetical protein